MMNSGIRARVLLVALVPSVLILLALVSYFTYARVNEVNVTLARQGVSVARQLAPGAEFALFAGDRIALQRMTDAAARETNVSGIRITDAEGRELARSGTDPARVDAAEIIEFAHPVFETRLATDIPERLNAAVTPAIVGNITVTMSRRGAYAEQRRLLATGSVLGLTCMLGAVLLAMVIGNSVIRPIRALAGAMRSLGHGAHVPPLVVSASGELRTLQDGFNDMSSRLQASTDELQARIDVAKQALSAERDTAQAATAAKSRFIAAASHDLRQPLHAIGMFTATLERSAGRSELAGTVANLAQAVAVMDRLFDSLLDISKLDAGIMRADPKPLRLAGLFGQLEAEHLEAAAQKDLTLRFRPTKAVVISDELLLHRLLGNLVANAIRYTSEGSVMVAARRRGESVQIEVRDSGIGIAPDHQDEIFGEFYQIGNPARDRSLGLGLGLAIVTRARLLGTEVRVRSAPGRGSVFFLHLARAGESDVISTASLAQEDLREAAIALPVLVVDDDQIALAGSRVLLENLGCRVTTATDEGSAETALLAMDDPPVLVFCDLWLSDQRSGIALLHRLAKLTTVPICGILISGDTRPEQLAKDAGFALLHKPVPPAKLRAVVTHFASTRRSCAMEGPP